MDKLPWLGASVKRKEDDRLLRGSGRFLDDIEETLALHLAIGRCPYPHARIRRIDATRALELSGVEAVLIGEQVVARTEPITVLRPFPGSAPTVFHGMAHGVARYEGEPVVAVAAVDRYVAEDALELIDKGAIGNLRSKDRVDFEATPEGGTRVTLTSEVAVGGMLGALGHKAIVSKSKEITEKFAQVLQAELRAGEAGR